MFCCYGIIVINNFDSNKVKIELSLSAIHNITHITHFEILSGYLEKSIQKYRNVEGKKKFIRVFGKFNIELWNIRRS
jgi:hypothetical protein